MSSTRWFLYALRCSDDTLYTGATTDVLRRLREHNRGRGARYTAGRRPLTLIAAWEFPDQSAAQQAEASFKRLPRQKKLSLIAQERAVAGSSFYRGPDIAEHLGQIRFCDRCGGVLDQPVQLDGARPRHRCTVCRRTHYQNAKPCAGALVEHDGRLLLVKRAIEPFLGYWDIPGGFLEADEHPRAGAIREVREETGLAIEPIDLFGIYIGRYSYGEAGDFCLNIYYSARVVGGRERPDDDAVEVAWFAPGELPGRIAFDHARQVTAEWEESIECTRHRGRG